MISKETEGELLRLYHAHESRIGTTAAQLALHHTTVHESWVELKAVVPPPSMADPFVPVLSAAARDIIPCSGPADYLR